LKKCAIVGIGNIMFCDDGLGVYAAEFIRRNFIIPPKVDVYDGGTLGFGMMTLFQEYETIVILSTTSEGESGDLFHFTKEELLSQGSVRQSANEVEVAQMLEICSILEDDEMAQIEIVAMHPGDIIPVETNLTPVVRKAFMPMIDKTLEVLRLHRIDLRPRKNSISLDAIIADYAHPRQQVNR